MNTNNSPNISLTLSSIDANNKKLKLIQEANVTKKKIDTKESIRYQDGTPLSVDISSSVAGIDDGEKNKLDAVISRASKADVLSRYEGLLSDNFGSLGDLGNLAVSANTFINSLKELQSVTGTGSTHKIQAVNTLQSHINQLKNLSINLQNSRQSAETERGLAFDKVNQLLLEIASINSNIKASDATSLESAGYIEQRNSLLEELSLYLDIEVQTVNSDFLVYTKNLSNNRTLIHSEKAAKFLYTPLDVVDANSTFNDILLYSIEHDTTNEQAQTFNVTDDFKNTNANGAIAALTHFLSSESSEISQKLDLYAETFRDKVNEWHNLSTSIGGRPELKGTPGYIGGSTLLGATALTGAGTLRISVINKATLESTNLSDIDISGDKTAQEICDLINGSGALATYLDAGIDATTGSLYIRLNNTYQNTHGIGLGSVSGSSAPSIKVNGSTTSYGFSEFFHLNDLITAPADKWRNQKDLSGYSANIGIASSLELAPFLVKANNFTNGGTLIDKGDSQYLGTSKLRDDAISSNQQAVSSDPKIALSIIDLFQKTKSIFPAGTQNASKTNNFQDYLIGIYQEIGNTLTQNERTKEVEEQALKQIKNSISEKNGIDETEQATELVKLSSQQDMNFSFINYYARLMKSISELGAH